MNVICQYVTNPTTGRVHLEPATPSGHRWTYCGKPSDEYVLGDETVSGLYATCKTCRMARNALSPVRS